MGPSSLTAKIKPRKVLKPKFWPVSRKICTCENYQPYGKNCLTALNTNMKYVTLDQQANQIEKLYDTMVGIHSCETLSSGLFIGPKMVSELRNNLIAPKFQNFSAGACPQTPSV